MVINRQTMDAGPVIALINAGNPLQVYYGTNNLYNNPGHNRSLAWIKRCDSGPCISYTPYR